MPIANRITICITRLVLLPSISPESSVFFLHIPGIAHESKRLYQKEFLEHKSRGFFIR